MKPLTDTHCHLSLDQFTGVLDSILERARVAGVGRLVIPGIDLETSRRAVEIAEELTGVYASVGVHPHNASSYSESVRDSLHELARSPAVVAVGEIGLDYYRDHSPRDLQVAALIDQLSLARELELPVIIHNREAREELFEVLLEWAPTVAGNMKGVLHAFSGTRASAETAVSLGFFIGVAGPLTYPNAEELRHTIRDLPPDRLLLETDSPYLPPQPHRGQRNEPAYLPLIAEELGRLTDREIDKLSADTSENADYLFGWLNGSANSILS
ncbi:MAG: TatD family hydrolase [Anaerolineae bacterium]|nr:MAG: TatD family hydrolase [Anaerolineae bacterium]